MWRSLQLGLALLALGGGDQGTPASQPSPTCTPQTIDRKFPKADPGARYEGYKRAPIVAFEVDEAGTVRSIKIERHSGSKAADTLALRWVQSLQYKPRPGCGILSSKISVTIDFTSP